LLKLLWKGGFFFYKTTTGRNYVTLKIKLRQDMKKVMCGKEMDRNADP